MRFRRTERKSPLNEVALFPRRLKGRRKALPFCAGLNALLHKHPGEAEAVFRFFCCLAIRAAVAARIRHGLNFASQGWAAVSVTDSLTPRGGKDGQDERLVERAVEAWKCFSLTMMFLKILLGRCEEMLRQKTRLSRAESLEVFACSAPTDREGAGEAGQEKTPTIQDPSETEGVCADSFRAEAAAGIPLAARLNAAALCRGFLEKSFSFDQVGAEVFRRLVRLFLLCSLVACARLFLLPRGDAERRGRE